MLEIPNNPSLGYIGVLTLALGVFLVLAGSGIINIDKIVVAQGAKTWGVGIVFVIVGILFLLSDNFKGLPPSTIATSTEVSADIGLTDLPTTDVPKAPTVNLKLDTSTPEPPTNTSVPELTNTPEPTNTPNLSTPIPPATNTSEPTPNMTAFIPPTSEVVIIPETELDQTIDDFENVGISLGDGFEINRNAGNDSQVSLVGIPHVNQGRQALALQFDIQNSPPNHYIGFDRALPPQDWSDYASLCFWIESDGSNRNLVLQFGESKYKFWKNIYSLSKGTGDYCIFLHDPHQINLRAIGYYGVYVEGPPAGQSIIYIDNVRLVNH